MKKVIIITPYFPPCGGVAVQRVSKFTKYLQEFGWMPVVFTPPAFATRMIKDQSMLNDIPKNIKVIKPFFIEYRRIIPGDIAKLFRPLEKKYLFPDLFVMWLPTLLKSIRKYLKTNKVDAIFITTPSFSLLKLVKPLSEAFHIHICLDMRDPFSTNIYNKDFERSKPIEYEAFQYSSAILSVSEFFTNDFKNIYPEFNEKFFFLPNGFDPDDFKNPPKHHLSRDLSFVFTGSVSSIVPLHQFLNAALKIFQEKNIRIVLKLATNIPKFKIFRQYKKYIDLGLLDYIGFKEHKDSIKQLLSHDCLLVTMVKNTNGNIPGKVGEYINCQKPILLLNEPDSYLSQYLRKTKTTYVADIDNEQEIIDQILHLYQLKQDGNLKPEGDQTVINQFDAIFRTQKLADLLNNIVSV